MLPPLVLCSSLAYCAVYATNACCRLAYTASRARLALVERVYDSAVMPLAGAAAMYMKSVATPAVRKGLTRRTLQPPTGGSSSADGASPNDQD